MEPSNGETSGEGTSAHPRVAAQDVLRAMQHGGAERAFIVLRDGKWDIPAYLQGGQEVGLPLGYLMMEHPYGVPFTLNEAYPFVEGAQVLMGFPDILFRPRDAFAHLVDRHEASEADIVLGLFPARTPSKMDMVERAEDGTVRSIEIKPKTTSLQYTWIIAVWGPPFTLHLHKYTEQLLRERPMAADWAGHEVHLGHAVQQAIDHGLTVQSVTFPDGGYIDIGTPDALARATQGLWSRPEH
jgi:glucose-1-phosphate thymidylyltransferase